MDYQSLTPDQVSGQHLYGEALLGAVVVASSNALRCILNLPELGVLSSPMPKFVTRLNPSVDNYFADLLLRSCYAPPAFVPLYEEHVVRGRNAEADPISENPRLIGASLIGVGGRMCEKHFHSVYDEHAEAGTRNLRSACEVVHERHIRHCPGVNLTDGYLRLLKEIATVDSKGGGGGPRYLYSTCKSLHMMRVRLPSFASHRVPVILKRALVEACLVSVVLHHDSLVEFNDTEALEYLKSVWLQEYSPWITRALEARYLPGRGYKDRNRVRDELLRESRADGPSARLLSIHRITMALRWTWPEEIARLFTCLLFDAAVQAQTSFHEIQPLCDQVWRRQPLPPELARRLQIFPITPARESPAYHHVVVHNAQPSDKLAHRGIKHWANTNRVKGLLVLRDRQLQITAVHALGGLEQQIWNAFSDNLKKKESDEVWYQPVYPGGRADFVLNGTEGIQTSPQTRMEDKDFVLLFQSCVGSYIDAVRRRAASRPAP